MRHLDIAEIETRDQANLTDLLQVHQRWIAELAFEHVIEPLPQSFTGYLAGVTRKWVRAIVSHHPEIIDPMTVIRMVMRPEDRVYLGYVIGKKLGAQVGRSVDKHPFARVVLDNDRNARAPVPRVSRVALAPVIPDARHAGRRTGAKHQQFHATALENNR